MWVNFIFLALAVVNIGAAAYVNLKADGPTKEENLGAWIVERVCLMKGIAYIILLAIFSFVDITEVVK